MEIMNKKIVEANIKLQDENITLRKDVKILERRIKEAIEYIENDLQIFMLPNNQIIHGNEVVKGINKIIELLKGEKIDGLD